MDATSHHNGRINASRQGKARRALGLAEKGRTKAQIAKTMGLSERYVYQLIKLAKDELTNTDHFPDPAPGLYPDWVKHVLERQPAEDVESQLAEFEAFFNTFSGRILSTVHKGWIAEALGNNRVLINCPPRHAKSTIFTVWFTLWRVCMDRNVQILLISQTEHLARKFTNEISWHLAYDEPMIRAFGRFKPELDGTPWRPNMGELMVDGRTRESKSGDLTIQVRGSGQQILGMETNWVVVDDAVSRKNINSETERGRLSEWFHGDVMSRLEPDSHAIVIGQRLHMYDLYGELSEERVRVGVHDKSWTHLNYPAVLDWEAETVLWPEKWTFDYLMQVYQDVGEDQFESMYQQNPLTDSKRLARKEWIVGSEDGSPGCLDHLRPSGQGTSDVDSVRVVSIDPSPTRFAGLIVADIPRSEHRFQCNIMEIVRETMSVREMIQHLDRVIALYNPDYFIFEQASAQRWFLQDPAMDRIRRQLRVVPHNTGRNKGDPVLGVESLALDFEFGRIRFPYGDAEGKAMSNLLIQEAYTYPQGLTDDLLMALWFIKYNYMRLIPVSRYGDQNARQGGFNVPPRLRDGWQWWKQAHENSARREALEREMAKR